MEYMVAKKFQSYEQTGVPFDINGKPYIHVKKTCDRCVKGIYVCRIENGAPVPHPAYSGVCLKCGGTGFIVDRARLYTKAEYEAMERTNARNAEKKEAARKAQIETEFAENKTKWLKDEGFDENGDTYIVTGDSYSIKEELKEAGFRFSKTLLWHKADPCDYADRCIKVNVSEIADFSAWGKGTFRSEAQKLIKDRLDALKPKCNSDFVGEVGEKLEEIPAVVESIRSFEGMYGPSRVITFIDEEENLYTWFTSSAIKFEKDDPVFLTGTIKEHKEYNGVKSTVLTRCKVS